MTDQKTHYVRPDVQGFLAFLNSTDAPPMSQLGLEAARASYIAMGQLAKQIPANLLSSATSPVPDLPGISRCASTTCAKRANPVRP